MNAWEKMGLLWLFVVNMCASMYPQEEYFWLYMGLHVIGSIFLVFGDRMPAPSGVKQ